MFRVKPTAQAIAKSSKVFFAPANKFATYKTSTGLVGLAVDPNGRATLQAISEQILQSVKVIQKWSTCDVQSVVTANFCTETSRRRTIQRKRRKVVFIHQERVARED